MVGIFFSHQLLECTLLQYSIDSKVNLQTYFHKTNSHQLASLYQIQLTFCCHDSFKRPLPVLRDLNLVGS